MALSVRVMATAGVLFLPLAPMLGVGFFVYQIVVGNPVFAGDLGVLGCSVALGVAAVMLVRRMLRHSPLFYGICTVLGLAAGFACTVHLIGGFERLSQQTAESDCKSFLGEDAPAPRIAACVPVAKRCAQEDKREAGEYRIRMWVGVNPCISDGVNALPGAR